MERESLSEAKRRLVDLLKRTGPSKVAGLAESLGLTDVAVRQHLQALEVQGLVAQERQPPSGRGRPSVHWTLTGQAGELFPDRHSELTVDLIDAVRETFGEEGLDRLIDVRSRAQLASYRRALPDEAPLRDRVEALARLRTVEGYMADVVEESPDDLVLVEHHCPICEAAKSCAGLCRSELEVFRQALGEDVRVERTRHLLSDDDRCAYRITKDS